jgi:hypothetical protein
MAPAQLSAREARALGEQLFNDPLKYANNAVALLSCLRGDARSGSGDEVRCTTAGGGAPHAPHACIPCPIRAADRCNEPDCHDTASCCRQAAARAAVQALALFFAAQHDEGKMMRPVAAAMHAQVGRRNVPFYYAHTAYRSSISIFTTGRYVDAQVVRVLHSMQ